MKTAPCPDCGLPTPQIPHLGINVCCDDCHLLRTHSADKRAIEEREGKMSAHWRAICPGGYADTRANDPRLNSTALEAARVWVRSRRGGATKGLALIGTSGIGKTRISYLALKAIHDAGERVMAIRAKTHARRAVEAAGGSHVDARGQDEARQTLRQCMTADVLLLDDLGKGKPTPRAVEAMEDLVEERTSRKRPIIWTANAGGEWLAEHFGADSGPPIVRRLAEFSHAPELPR